MPRTSDAITIDGVMDEAAWRQATQISLDNETHPGENIPALVDTTAYIIEDGERLYIAFDARDPDPSQIRAFLQDRDSAWNDDFVGVVLDTYNDERRAFEFFSNPLGVQMDLTNDDVNQREDSSWDAIWDAAGSISEQGYVVEMEIPLSQLRFPKKAGKQTWGIDLIRFYPRDKRHRLSNNVNDRSRNCYLCNFDEIEGMDNAKPGRDLEIVPTLTSSRTDSTDDPGVVPLQSGNTETEAGVSVRWGATPDMTLNLAINPDFSQIEADVAQLDVNNQFALFFPETRPFYLEGADYFTTPMNAVFTRTVADPDLAAKITGKRGNHTYGAFVSEDVITNLIFPGAFGSDSTSLEEGNTAFVGRYSLGFGESSSVGALLTTRTGDGYHNYLGGFDLSWRINDSHSIRAQYLETETLYPDDLAIEYEQPLGEFSGSGEFLMYEYESRNWNAHAIHYGLDRGFRADSGFEPQVDATLQGVGGRYVWFGEEDDWWTRVRLRGNAGETRDDDGQILEREVEAYLGVGGSMQSWTQIGFEREEQLWDGVVYKGGKIKLYTSVKPVGGLQLGLFADYGDQIDFANSRQGDQLRLEPFVDWNVNRHLLMKLQATILDFDTKGGEKIFDASVFDLRLTWQFNRRSFLRLTTQYQDVRRNQDVYFDEVDSRTRNMGRELLFSYKLNPQTVFFLGYSDKHFEDDELNALEETGRTWFMKIGYAWTP